MFRKAVLLIASLTLSISLVFSSVPEGAYGYDDLSFSAMASPSYLDSFANAMVNVSALSRIEKGDQFYFTFIASEAWDTSLMKRGEKLSGLQNLKTEMHFSFVGNSLSLSGIASTWFADRALTEGTLSYDIYNRIGLQIDWAGRFDFFSFGLRIKGGGDMRRRGRDINGVLDAVENAYFGSFDNVDGSEYFDIGASAALDFDWFFISYGIDSIIGFRGNEIYIGWEELLESSVFGLSLRSPKFTSRGDLTLLRPRVALSVHGNIFSRYTFTCNAGLEMQLLPSLSLHLAAAYREYDHGFFNFNSDKGVLMFAFAVHSSSYSLALMCNVDTASFTRVYPSISFTLSR